MSVISICKRDVLHLFKIVNLHFCKRASLFLCEGVGLYLCITASMYSTLETRLINDGADCLSIDETSETISSLWHYQLVPQPHHHYVISGSIAESQRQVDPWVPLTSCTGE